MRPVVVITGVPANQNEIATLAQQLKKLCGSGGTVEDGVIEIQGDHCDWDIRSSALGDRRVNLLKKLSYYFSNIYF